MSDQTSGLGRDDRLTEIMRKHMIGAVFMPLARHDPGLDWVFVLNKDVSTSTIPVDGTALSLLENNYPEVGGDRYVGFTFAGARKFCEHYRLIDFRQQVELHRLLDTLAMRHGATHEIFEARQTLSWLHNKKVQLL